MREQGGGTGHPTASGTGTVGSYMYMNQVQVLHVYVCTLVSVCVLYNTRAVLAGTAVHTLLMHLVRKQYCLGAYRYEYMYMLYYGSSRA